MKMDATSLERLHDIVLPPPVPWWPLAPGWYVVFILFALTAVWLSWRFWQRWKRQAYRREALRQLAGLQDITSIAELLRRTALAVAPRAVVATKTGDAWVEWLAEQSPDTMSVEVHQMLTFGVYGRPVKEKDVSLLRGYAARWISRHCMIVPDEKGKFEE